MSEGTPAAPKRQLAEAVRTWLPIWAAVLGGLWAAWTYIDQQDRNARREAQVALVEAQKPFLEKRQDLYFEAAKVAGALGHTDPKSPEWKALEDRFYALYWGELSLVEGKDVEARMIDVETKLRSYKDGVTGGASALSLAALCLAHVMRGEIETGWGRPPSEDRPPEGCG